MGLEEVIISAKYEDRPVVFTEKQRLSKISKRPELRDNSFLSRIKSAIETPDFIYEDIGPRKRLVFYKLEYKVNGIPRYTKVVVGMDDNPFFVVTAYRPDYVKERGKSKLVYGKDE